MCVEKRVMPVCIWVWFVICRYVLYIRQDKVERLWLYIHNNILCINNTWNIEYRRYFFCTNLISITQVHSLLDRILIYLDYSSSSKSSASILLLRLELFDGIFTKSCIPCGTRTNEGWRNIYVRIYSFKYTTKNTAYTEYIKEKSIKSTIFNP